MTEEQTCEALGRALIDAHSRGIKPGEGMALIKDADSRLAYQRWIKTIRRLAAQVELMGRLAEEGLAVHQEQHERELRRLGELLQQAIDGRRRDGNS